MDFRDAIGEVSKVEESASEYSPPKIKEKKVERSLELSPPDIHEMDYVDIINQYNRMDKIIKASRMDIGMFGAEKVEAAEPAIPSPAKVPKEASEVEKEMKKISIQSAREAAQVPGPAPEAGAGPAPEEAPKEGEGAPPAPRLLTPAEVEMKKAEEAAKKLPELPEVQEVQKTLPPKPEEEKATLPPEPEVVPTPKEVPSHAPEKEIRPLPEKKPFPGPEKKIQPIPEKPKKAVPEEVAPLPAPVKEEIVSGSPETEGPVLDIVYPKVLSKSPLKEAESTINRLETQLGAQMTGKKTKKVDVEDTKKRMLELTRELFKERSQDRRAEIKKEIVTLKELIKGKGGKADAGGLPKGTLFTALENEQKLEVKEAKNRIQSIYEKNVKSALSAFEAQRAVRHRGPALEEFSKNMVELEHRLMEIIEKYQAFLTAKHSSELAKLKAKGQSTPASEKLKSSLKVEYSHDFSTLKDTIGGAIHSQIETKRELLLEKAGDPSAMKLAQVSSVSDEALFNLLQAKDSRTYNKYARGEIERSEALLLARKLMAKEAGIDEDTINKRFGGK